MIWLSIGVSEKVTKMRTTPILVSYPKQVPFSKTDVLLFCVRIFECNDYYPRTCGNYFLYFSLRLTRITSPYTQLRLCGGIVSYRVYLKFHDRSLMFDLLNM